MPTYSCGHTGETPAHMGRGEARAKRIAAHFAGKCPVCHRAAVEATAATLCVLLPGYDTNGKRNFRKYNAEEIAAYVRKRCG